MTHKQYLSIFNLIAAYIEKCKTEDETKEAAKLIREITQNLSPNSSEPLTKIGFKRGIIFD